jgi:hypothetical protein
MQTGFDTRPIEMQPMWLVVFQAPEEDVDRIFDAITEVAPLVQGNIDKMATVLPPGQNIIVRAREPRPAQKRRHIIAPTWIKCAFLFLAKVRCSMQSLR